MLSIIILTFNSIKYIKPCLDSLFYQDYKDFEAIIVDNSSKDGTVALVKRDYPEVNLIENPKNFGACRARNQAIEASCGEWILSLDCDVTLEKTFLQKVSEVIKDLPPEIGILQPRILKEDRKTIYSTGIYLSRLRRFFDIGKGRPDNGQFNCQKYIFGACSAAAVYKRQMLEEIKEDSGYFDERFFFLVEDVDLAWRAQKKGWKGLFCPEANCYHFGNSSCFDKKLRQYLCFRNRYYTIKKNEGFKRYSKKVAPLLFYDLPRLFYLVFTNRTVIKTLREINQVN
ncbi:MAG: glycosyltransferase family 2 protein [Candidatus Omnitrophica bacterium]|nr:glycosyltransferase family 2 protein [Candidatus Omnitrophota bacterium]